MSGTRYAKKESHHLGRRILIIFGLTLLSFLVLFFGATTIVCYGPSESARNLFVTSVMETSAAKFLARIYYSDSEIEGILSKNTAIAVDEITDEKLIDIPTQEQQLESTEPDVQLIDVTGPTYKGKLMIIKDPSRVVVSTSNAIGENARGMKISELVDKYSGIAGINAGGVGGENGMGSGGQPLGIVISDGQLIQNGSGVLVGFDNSNKLIVGSMTGTEAIEMGIRDAVTFGPVFIVNGKRSGVAGTGGGLNPRTCIGQRADGAVLLLVIDGRQAQSLGATFGDCIDLMEEYGAVNAANLDGGSSSTLYYGGEVVNVCASVYGARDIPTAFVVLPE